MAKHRRSGFMKRLGRMFANLGGLYGRLYGAGNAGSVTADDGGPPAKTTRRPTQKKRRKRRH